MRFVSIHALHTLSARLVEGLVWLGMLLLAWPLLALLGAWLGLDDTGLSLWSHMAKTVLGEYSLTSLALGAGVALGVALIGGSTAAAVVLLDFPGRRTLEWALLLPMAMPAYVLAYAYADTLQFSGPLQTALRAHGGLTGPLWPDIRSLPGAICLLSLCLYPYAYLLTRAALINQGPRLLEAAAMLGAGKWRQIFRVALPVARPALATGVLLATMEALADYGVGAYFGLSTFTTGIYRAWLSMDAPLTAAQLASVLMLVMAVLVVAEKHSRRGIATTRGQGHGRAPEGLAAGRQSRSGGWWIAVACAMPVLLGFVLPTLALLRLMWQEAQYGEFGLPWSDFMTWSYHSVMLATLTSVLALGVALAMGFLWRTRPSPALGLFSRMVVMGYAVPGVVIAVGVLFPIGLWHAWWASHGQAAPDWLPTAWVSGTLLGLLYAYLVRLTSISVQTIDAGYAQIPTSLDDSARLLGVQHLALWWRVHAPLLWRSSLAAALLVFVDTMKELPATLVLRPFNTDTLAVVAYQLARDERLGEAALPSLAMVLVGLAPVWLLSRAMRR